MDEQRRMNWLVEREKLLSNLNALRSSSAKMSALTQELRSLQEESEFLHADVRALKAKLNQTALDFGLEPLH